MFGLGRCGEIMTVNLDQDISKELAMLRGIDYERRNQKIRYERDRELVKYNETDAMVTLKMHEYMQKCIVKVIFNDPATIVFWGDGTKTVVKAVNEPFDPEKGLAMAIAKYHFGNEGNYYNVFRQWLPKEEEVSDGAEEDEENAFARKLEEADKLFKDIFSNPFKGIGL